MALDPLLLPVSFKPDPIFNQSHEPSFPMPVVYRVYDNCLANGIEAIFGFCLALMQKNEDQLLRLKFDEILSYLNNKLLSPYRVSII
jgi:hypothetical protein